MYEYFSRVCWNNCESNLAYLDMLMKLTFYCAKGNLPAAQVKYPEVSRQESKWSLFSKEEGSLSFVSVIFLQEFFQILKEDYDKHL